MRRLHGKTAALATGRDTEMEQKAGEDSGTEPGPQDKGGGGMVQFTVQKQSLCMVEAEKFVLRGARASPGVVGWASWGPRMNSKQKQGATQQDLSCGQAQELPLEGAAAAPDKLGRGSAALHTLHLDIAATQLPWVICCRNENKTKHLVQGPLIGPGRNTCPTDSWKVHSRVSGFMVEEWL